MTNVLMRHAQLLSNGSFTTLLTGAGTGFSRVGDTTLSRWNGDRIEDAEGYFFYLRDAESGRHWSLGAQPGGGVAAQRAAGGDAGSCWISATADGIEARLEAALDPERDVEVRSILLSNLSDRARKIELTSYLEVVLNRQSEEAGHPAFSKLFVQTEHDAGSGALLAHRRPRGEGEAGLWMVHAAAGGEAAGFETDRTRFVGRGRDLRTPVGMDGALSGTAGNVLDPAFSLRRSVTLAPGGQARVVFVLGAAPSRDQALALVSAASGDGLPLLAAARTAGEALRQQIGLSAQQAAYCQRLAGAMLYGQAGLRLPPAAIAVASALIAAPIDAGVATGEVGAAAHGLPPIDVLLWATRPGDADVELVLQARRYWAAMGLHFNVLLLGGDGAWATDDGLHVRDHASLSTADLAHIELNALLVLRDGLPALDTSDGAALSTPIASNTPKATLANGPAAVSSDAALRFFNGNGGFTEAGDEYVIRMDWDADRGLHRPPLAWTNAISNEHFGFLVSDSGAGYTWSRNSRVHRLTPWYNDPIRDPHGEALYVRDEDNGQFWSPVPGPATACAGYEAAHGFGYTRFRHISHGLEQQTTMFVPRHDPVKLVRVRVTNHGDTARRLSLFSYQRLVLGSTPADSSRFIVTEHDPAGVLLATNPLAGVFADGVTFAAALAADNAAVHHSADRAAFIGLHGSTAQPAALAAPRLDGVSGAGLDPCAALQVVQELAPGATLECVFLLGETVERNAALELVRRYSAPGAVQQAYDEITAFWRKTVGAVQVRTPAPAVDLMLNGWLAYQNLSCRIWGRSAFYQSGGALGYRDQLQDSSAMIYARPDLTRQQIRIHAAHQFVEGDVLHWWHTAPMEQGLRTRFSDDLLWLPYITAFYVHTTGDRSVLDEVEPFLTARHLEDGEDEVYLKPELSGESADIYEHCCRALDRSLTQGAHGLPLMGTGDWNDGMNRVGQLGKGESVWLGFFGYQVLEQFAETARLHGDHEFSRRCSDNAHLLRRHLDQNAWDGAWYRRAWFDDGQVLGSASNEECRIDSIAQSWSVLSGAGSPARQHQAMQSVDQHLIKRDIRAVLLLDPPFDKSDLDPGYIKGYVPGVRENGGQYTHAAVWAGMAFARLGDVTNAWEVLNLINPADPANNARIDTYKVEPYVMAADVYGTAPHAGRGGWTWYTGSAGWMYRLIVESLLGVQRVGDTLRIEPLIPLDWPGFTLHYRFGKALYHFDVRQGSSVMTSMTLDGQPLNGNALRLSMEDGERWVRVDCRARTPHSQTLSFEHAVDE